MPCRPPFGRPPKLSATTTYSSSTTQNICENLVSTWPKMQRFWPKSSTPDTSSTGGMRMPGCNFQCEIRKRNADAPDNHSHPQPAVPRYANLLRRLIPDPKPIY